jgi:hypothetical protein
MRSNVDLRNIRNCINSKNRKASGNAEYIKYCGEKSIIAICDRFNGILKLNRQIEKRDHCVYPSMYQKTQICPK